MKKLFVGQKQRICMRVFWPITAANSAPGRGEGNSHLLLEATARHKQYCFGQHSVYILCMQVGRVCTIQSWLCMLSGLVSCLFGFLIIYGKSMIISRFFFSTLSYIMMMLGYPKDFRQRVAKHIHFYCISIFFNTICSICCLSAVRLERDRGRGGGENQLFYCASFQQLFAYIFQAQVKPNQTTHITVYIFYKFDPPTPSLISISQCPFPPFPLLQLFLSIIIIIISSSTFHHSSLTLSSSSLSWSLFAFSTFFPRSG